MKHLLNLTVIPLICFCSLASANMEVFCTKSQCDKAGVNVVPKNTEVYIVDAHLRTADIINNTLLRGVTTLAQAESLLPKIQSTPLYNQMISQLKSSGEGLQKVVRDYDLKKLPAFVCHREHIQTGLKEQAVIYGGSISKAQSICSLWAARGRHE